MIVFSSPIIQWMVDQIQWKSALVSNDNGKPHLCFISVQPLAPQATPRLKFKFKVFTCRGIICSLGEYFNKHRVSRAQSFYNLCYMSFVTYHLISRSPDHLITRYNKSPSHFLPSSLLHTFTSICIKRLLV